MKNIKGKLIAGGVGFGIAVASVGAVAAIDKSIFTEVIGSSPNVQGQSDATQYGWGDPAKGEKATLVVERTKQRPGNSDDDGPAFTARNTQNNQGFAALVEARNTNALTVTNGGNNPALRVDKPFLGTNGNKRGVVGAHIDGTIKITGKKSGGSNGQENTAELYVEGDDLKVRINGEVFILTP